jgi:hypothetical protein
MSLWHADTNASSLAAGARMLVVSADRDVRVITADQLSIETPEGGRLNAVVIDRTGEKLTLGLPDGTPVRLSMRSNSSDDPTQVGLDFSRQLWVVN